MRIPYAIALGVGLSGLLLSTARADLPKGINEFEQHQWNDAIGDFLEVLQRDPGNVQAHQYVALAVRQLETEKREAAREKRLEILGDASKRLDDNRMDSTLLETAIQNTTQAEEKARQERWHARCEQARVERQLGHLFTANDLIFQILQENSSDAEAQRELSELQSALRQTLDHGSNLSVPERFTLQGFYAYGQADYTSAFTAWQKGRSIMEQSYPAAEAARMIQDLRFTNYEKIAQAHVEEDQQLAQREQNFEKGVALFKVGHFTQALELFRQIAIQDPQYPQLGTYLVKAEAEAEQERARRLGQEKTARVNRLIENGVARLEAQDYEKAARCFEEALALDPSHAQAQSYLTMAQSEINKTHDPKGAQMHYEAGLIDYASGKLEDAVREWRMTLRMDPEHEKAANALNKVQRELALYREAPVTP